MNKIRTIKDESISYMTFIIGEEVFASHVAFVNNIIEVTKITEMPNTPDFFKGIVNLRGSVLPVIDTRIKFGMSPTEFTALTCILVLEINYKNKIIHVGALVDDVQEVIEIENDKILPPPEINGLQSTNKFIEGIISLKDQFIMLLNIDMLFDKKYLGDISKQIAGMKDAINEVAE